LPHMRRPAYFPRSPPLFFPVRTAQTLSLRASLRLFWEFKPLGSPNLYFPLKCNPTRRPFLVMSPFLVTFPLGGHHAVVLFFFFFSFPRSRSFFGKRVAKHPGSQGFSFSGRATGGVPLPKGGGHRCVRDTPHFFPWRVFSFFQYFILPFFPTRALFLPMPAGGSIIQGGVCRWSGFRNGRYHIVLTPPITVTPCFF